MDNTTLFHWSDLDVFHQNISLLAEEKKFRNLSLRPPTLYPVDYRIVGTVFFILIFSIGFFGNILICLVVKRTKAFHTPTYYYLVSLAIADLFLLFASIPDSIMSYHLYGRQWVLGHAGCSLTVFLTFLAINVGSTNMMAFTAERYIAICKPLLAHKLCTPERAKKIIMSTWIALIIYCSPWLGLVGTQPLNVAHVQGLEKCDFLISRNAYLSIFLADVTLFYVLLLILSVVLYTRICITMYSSMRKLNEKEADGASSLDELKPLNGTTENEHHTKNLTTRFRCFSQQFSISHFRKRSSTDFAAGRSFRMRRSQMALSMRSRFQVVKMLVIVVTVFALLWLPYRGLLVYNSLVKKPWLNKWFILTAKNLVYLSSAINPFLYSVLNKRFRMASLRVLSELCGSSRDRRDTVVIADKACCENINAMEIRARLIKQVLVGAVE